MSAFKHIRVILVMTALFMNQNSFSQLINMRTDRYGQMHNSAILSYVMIKVFGEKYVSELLDKNVEFNIDCSIDITGRVMGIEPIRSFKNYKLTATEIDRIFEYIDKNRVRIPYYIMDDEGIGFVNLHIQTLNSCLKAKKTLSNTIPFPGKGYDYKKKTSGNNNLSNIKYLKQSIKEFIVQTEHEKEICNFIKTTNAYIRDTIYIKNKRQYIEFDTIPYMYMDKYFFEAYNELCKMYSGEEKYCLKRAEFLVEWAYNEGKANYSKFCSDIADIASILKKFIKTHHLENKRIAPNYALFEYFTKPSPMNSNKPFSYDFEDFAGNKDFSKLFVSKVISTHTGQCVSLPLLYKILCDEINGEAFIALAPMHTYIKHLGDDGKWVNIELTNGHFFRDIWMIKTSGISINALQKGTFMAPLSDKENIALMIMLLAKAYRQKYGNWDFFTLRCADRVIADLPHFSDALVVKHASHQAIGLKYISRYGDLRSDFQRLNNILELQTINMLDYIGFTNLSTEECENNVKKAIEEGV